LSDTTYYQQLEQGARYLAARALNRAERLQHLGHANRYSRLAEDARWRHAQMTA